MKILVLDDSRQAQFKDRLSAIGLTDTTFVTTSKECISMLQAHTYDIIFLDYDLTYMEIDHPSSENSGAVVARWLSEHRMNHNHQARIVIHAVDPYGSQYMKEFLPRATVFPGVWLENRFQELLEQLNLDIPHT
jgi:hypothetical protein